MIIAALAALRGKFQLDIFRRRRQSRGLDEQVEHTLELVDLTARADRPVAALAYGEKRRLEIGLALGQLAEPAAARRAARRHEPARAGRDGHAAQVDRAAAAP